MQKRAYSREFKLDIVRQVATGQKRLLRHVENMALRRVSFLAGGKSIKSKEKLHFNLHKQMDQRRKSSGLPSLSSSVDNWLWKIRF